MIERLFSSYDVDIWGFQEVMPRQMEALKELLPNHGWHGQGRENRRGAGEGCYVFWDEKADLEVLHKETFWLAPDPDQTGLAWDAKCPRVCNQLKFRSGGRDFWIYNLHLDHEGALSRIKSAELIRQRVQSSGLPALVIGDFNIENAVQQLPAFEGFQDAVASHGADREGTFHGFGGIPLRGAIDYVLTTPEFGVDYTQLLKDSWDGRFPSDHYPLLAQVHLAQV